MAEKTLLVHLYKITWQKINHSYKSKNKKYRKNQVDNFMLYSIRTVTILRENYCIAIQGQNYLNRYVCMVLT